MITTKHVLHLESKKFGKLSVLSFDSVRGSGRHAYWLCRCDCGNKVITRGSHLRTNQVRSCGCVGRLKSSMILKKYANSAEHRGLGNPMWKGDKAKHSSIHTWLAKHFKKGERCIKCNKTNKKLDWALKKGCKYSHNVKNYIVLCRSCHLKYDYTKKRRENLRESLRLHHLNKQKINK